MKKRPLLFVGAMLLATLSLRAEVTPAEYRGTGKDTLEERSTGDWAGILLWQRKS